MRERLQSQAPLGEVRCGAAIAAARRALTHVFRAAALDTPELDARVLIGDALDLDHAGLASAAERHLSAADAAKIVALARRRLAREPVARIVGAKEFWGLEFRLNDATLVPRPDGETVVEAALAALDIGGLRRRALTIADLGTGSGALLVALLRELPNAFGIGTDVACAALAAARENAARARVADRAAFSACDFAAALGGGFDLVVANPPYVKTSEIARLAPEVRDHEPRLALDGGSDGLTCYRAIARDAERLLHARGRLVVEVAAGAAPEVGALFSAAGLRRAAAHCDLAGVTRALVFAANSRHACDHV